STGGGFSEGLDGREGRAATGAHGPEATRKAIALSNCGTAWRYARRGRRETASPWAQGAPEVTAKPSCAGAKAPRNARATSERRADLSPAEALSQGRGRR